MNIDIPYFLIILLALYKGYQKGFIVAFFSFFAFIIGIAAAIKLSAVVAHSLSVKTNINTSWLPFLSFLLVLICVIFLIRLLSGLVQKSVEYLMMGWANKLGGILLYASIYTMIFSVLLFYAIQLEVLKQDAIKESTCYFFIKPWASYVFDNFGKVFPFFKNMFSQLENFFEASSKKL